jgi:uncharacterized protein YxeA
MAVKAVSIGSDGIGTSRFASSLRLSGNPLISFKDLSKKRLFIILAVIAAIMSSVFAIAQASGDGKHNSSSNTSNGSSSSTDQHPENSSSGQPQQNATNPSTSSNTNTGGSSNSSSTSVTVNGQSVDVPQSGAYDKSVNIPGGNVHVSGSTAQSATDGSSATNSSSTNVEINSE